MGVVVAKGLEQGVVTNTSILRKRKRLVGLIGCIKTMKVIQKSYVTAVGSAVILFLMLRVKGLYAVHLKIIPSDMDRYLLWVCSPSELICLNTQRELSCSIRPGG